MERSSPQLLTYQKEYYMERFLNSDVNVKTLSPLNLAFVGDTVFDLFVRERLVCQANRPVNKLHKEATTLVKASAQAEAMGKIMHLLNEEEISVFKRGRNAHTNHKAKNASEGDYHYATGLEALFGYLYLSGEKERLRELFDIIVSE